MTPKIGLVGTINNSGLGQLAKQLHRLCPVHTHFVIPHMEKGTHLQDVKGDYIVATEWDAPMDANFERFIATKPDIVVFFEYPYNWGFIPKLKRAGIKIVWIPMIDSVGTPWLRKEGAINHIDLFIAPTKYCHQVLLKEDLPSFYVPWPIDTDYFSFKQRGLNPGGTVFVHNIGRGGDGRRKGWDLVLQAWRKKKPKGSSLIVHSQISAIDTHLLQDVDFRCGDMEEAHGLYAEGDVYLSPSRKEGLGLPFREAMSCGMPVVGTNIPPLNEVITDTDFLVQHRSQRPIGKVQNGFVYEPCLNDLIRCMGLAATCGNIPERSVRARERIVNEHSWSRLGPVYNSVFERLVS
jgi:glycosyltransferase involved in cell wall biosynthesis